MTQEKYQEAIKFAGEKHKDQKVPGTEANYLLHISNVAMEILMAYKQGDDFDINYAVELALLHDTLEDTETNVKELEERFGRKVALGVQALTKDDNLSTKEEKIKDTLNRINEMTREVGMVKLADRITNLQKPPESWNKDKIQKYLEEARIISQALSGKHQYLNDRLVNKIAEYKAYVK